MTALVLVVGILGACIGFTVWAINRGRSTGRNEVIVDHQAEVIKDLQTRNEVERATPVTGAADRLRKSRWVREESLPAGSADHDQHRRSTDRRDGAAN